MDYEIPEWMEEGAAVGLLPVDRYFYERRFYGRRNRAEREILETEGKLKFPSDYDLTRHRADWALNAVKATLCPDRELDELDPFFRETLSLLAAIAVEAGDLDGKFKIKYYPRIPCDLEEKLRRQLRLAISGQQILSIKVQYYQKRRLPPRLQSFLADDSARHGKSLLFAVLETLPFCRTENRNVFLTKLDRVWELG